MQSGRNDSTVCTPPLLRRVRVVVADSFPIVLLGVRKLIEEDPRLQIVAELSTMPSLLETLTAETPDVALVDWSLASEDLKATATMLQSSFRKTALIFFTSSEDEGEKRGMMRLGARDVVSKRASAVELQNAVWNALIRNPSPQLAATETVPAPNESADPQLRILRLTRRERQLIPLVCGGMRNKAIAEYLGIAESTVWHHLTAVFTKLQVDDRMGLAAFAYRQGIVMPSPPMSVDASLRVQEAS